MEYLYMLRTARQNNRKALAEGVKEVVGGILFAAIVVGFCALCIAASGYHWE